MPDMHFDTPAIHNVSAVMARTMEFESHGPVASIDLVFLADVGDRQGPCVTMYFRGGDIPFARDLTDAINGVLAKHRQGAPIAEAA